MRRITLNTLRRLTAAEEAMMRAVMPRASARDAEALVPAHAQGVRVLAVRGGLRLVRPLTATVQEVTAC